ncbi:hypothetical protein OXIME_001103 [Oxyplasma meridianum]|uniref:DUF1453 domain-containing protein n=1 Tax=Oxyplasma meridianum TaxID=3073602 RepID=A0AAX4NGB4_9ARCH
MFRLLETAENIYNRVYAEILSYKLASFLAIVVIFLSRKIVRSLHGGRFTRRSLIVGPLLYIAFTVIADYGIGFLNTVFAILAFLFGMYISIHTGKGVTFYTKNDLPYYKRPLWVIGVWSVAFIGRMIIIFFFPGYTDSFFSVLLGFATGLIIGEALQIVWQNRIAASKKTDVKDSNSLFLSLIKKTK